jgi:hypothetical protein
VNEQKPSVGRIVLFEEKGGPYAAIITRVNDGSETPASLPGTVELATFGPNSVYFQHGVPYNAEAHTGTWRWPPRV